MTEQEWWELHYVWRDGGWALENGKMREMRQQAEQARIAEEIRQQQEARREEIRRQQEATRGRELVMRPLTNDD